MDLDTTQTPGAPPPSGPSMLDSLLNAGDKHVPESGLPTPQDIIKAEEAARNATPAAPPASPQAPPAAPGQPPPAAPPVPATEFDYDALMKKVEGGQELTGDEQAALLMMQKDLETPSPAEPTYNIGGKILTKAEVEAKVREEFNLGELDISAAAMGKMVERYVKSENRTEFQRSTQQKSMANAAESARLQQERIANEAKALTLKQMRERIRAEREALAAAAKVVLTEDQLKNPETGELDPMKLIAFTDAKRASARLQSIEAEDQRLAQEEDSANLKKLVYAFTEAHPQYITTEDAFALFEKMQRGETIPDVDVPKVLEIDNIISEAQQKKISPEMVYKYRKSARLLAVPEAAQPAQIGKLGLPELKTQPQSILEIIRRHRERNQKAPTAIPPAAPTDKGVDPNTRVSTQIIRGDQARLGNARDPFLEQLGFQKSA